MALAVGSLFSGIGGFDLGLERAGMHVVWQCEQDQFCQRVLAKHWPGVPCYGDITQLRGRDVQPVDVLCGGFPCQDISLAGKGAGLAGTRSGLWSEYARLIGELRPRYVVVENVPALRRRGLAQVLEDLTARGYDAEWDGIPASAVGAPHQRDRIWLVAYTRSESGWLAEHRSGGQERRSTDPREPALVRQGNGSRGTEGLASCDRARDVAEAEGVGRRAQWPQRSVKTRTDFDVAAAGRQWLTEPDVGRVANGVPMRVDRLRSLGNALVPQIAEWIGHRIVNWEGQG